MQYYAGCLMKYLSTGNFSDYVVHVYRWTLRTFLIRIKLLRVYYLTYIYIVYHSTQYAKTYYEMFTLVDLIRFYKNCVM